MKNEQIESKVIFTTDQDKTYTRWMCCPVVLSVILLCVAQTGTGTAQMVAAFFGELCAILPAVLSAVLLGGALINCRVYKRRPGLWALAALVLMLLSVASFVAGTARFMRIIE